MLYKSDSGDKQAVFLKSTQILSEQEHGTKILMAFFTSLCLQQWTPTNLLKKKKEIHTWGSKHKDL